ncbi:hypothetical protein F7725_002691 [Dissostichus mawsoni]|uniref:Titin n=1 Tax=Dissostichus mawsoni TaxID=36200 RepID=A0A7J5Y330_DISMA|nr:hypothetical protein F7725_002691 [Dissostichus mawsoni]
MRCNARLCQDLHYRNLKWRDKSGKSIFLFWEPSKYDGGAPIKGYIPPEIQLDVKLLAGLTARAGTKIELPADVKGKPDPRVKWTKADQVLRADDRITMDTQPGHSKLSIANSTRGDTATYIIEAVNACGRATATIDINPAPPAFDLSDITNESCCMAWNPPRDDGGSLITNYIVESRQTDKEEWVKLSATVKHTTFKACKLTALKEYVFRVSAENQYGIGQPAEHAPIIAKYSFEHLLSVSDPPGAPTRVTPSDITKDAVSLTWFEPDEDGGSPITGYWIEKFDPESDKWIRCNKLPIKDTSFREKVLISCVFICIECCLQGEGTPHKKKYSFRVLAENLAGPGKPSVETDPVLIKDPIDPPWAPGKPAIREVGKTTALLAWTRPEHDGGAKIESYIIEFQKAGSEEWIRLMEDVPQTEQQLTGLVEHQEYCFRVKAVNKAGESEASEPSDPVGLSITYYSIITRMSHPLSPPSAPQWLEVASITKVSAGLKWQAPSSDGGSPITNYVVEKRDVRRKAWQAVDTTVKELKYTVTPLNEGSLYVFRVAAENAAGMGEFCEMEDAVLAKDTFSEYRLLLGLSSLKKEKLGSRWLKCCKTPDKQSQFKVTDVDEGTEVQFQVRAENEAGVGDPSEPTEILTIEDATIPGIK